ncbi:phage tail protein [Arenimonas alkanexedens]
MSQPYVGEIRLFPYNFAPNGWQECNGSLLSIAEHEVLFALIGTIYGGNGQTTFAVPDLRGRVPVHQFQGPGLSNRVIGQSGGSEAVTVLAANMPAHSHTVVATTQAATSGTPGNTVVPGAVSDQTQYVTDLAGGRAFTQGPAATSPAGGSQPHENCMPTLTATYCISLFGIFPTRS